VLLKSILRPALFNILIYDLDNGAESIFRQREVDTKLGGVVDRSDDYITFQKDLDRL